MTGGSQRRAAGNVIEVTVKPAAGAVIAAAMAAIREALLAPQRAAAAAITREARRWAR